MTPASPLHDSLSQMNSQIWNSIPVIHTAGFKKGLILIGGIVGALLAKFIYMKFIRKSIKDAPKDVRIPKAPLYE